MSNMLSIFDDFQNDFFPKFIRRFHSPALNYHSDIHSPSFNSQGENHILTLDIPGVPRENLKIEIQDRHLSINTEYSKEDAEGAVTQRNYQYSFLIPDDVDSDAIDVTLKHGVLTITMPRTGKGKARLLEIQEAS